MKMYYINKTITVYLTMTAGKGCDVLIENAFALTIIINHNTICYDDSSEAILTVSHMVLASPRSRLI